MVAFSLATVAGLLLCSTVTGRGGRSPYVAAHRRGTGSRAQERHRIRLGGEAVRAPEPVEGWRRAAGGDKVLWSMDQ